MSEISRRGFLKGAQASLVAAGIVAVAPVTMSMAANATTSKTRQTSPVREDRAFASSETVVIHIPNPKSGELRLMVGEREIVRHDHALVARLIREVR